MTAATLHSLAEEMSAAFNGGTIAMSKSERIVELAEAQWVGVQESDEGPVVLFRDPVTTTCLALFESALTVAGVVAKLEGARKLFGAKS
jgi:hypothetical protein